MAAKSLRLQLEIDVQAVTCPGVWFSTGTGCSKAPLTLSICFLGFHVKTKPFPPTFPLLFGDRFVLEKTFPGCNNLLQLQATLDEQPLYIELLQEDTPCTGEGPVPPPVVLATFETTGLEFLFPFPQLRPTYNSGVDVDLLMEPTRDFPGIISPKIEASTRSHIVETRHAHLDQLHDSALNLNLIPPVEKHPHLGDKARRSRSKSLEGRGPFAWRKAEDTLIGRRPDPDAAELDHHHQGCNHKGDHGYGVGGLSRTRSMANMAVCGMGNGRQRHRSSASSAGGSATPPPANGPVFMPRERGRSRERRGKRVPHFYDQHQGLCGPAPPAPPSTSSESPSPPPPENLPSRQRIRGRYPTPPQQGIPHRPLTSRRQSLPQPHVQPQQPPPPQQQHHHSQPHPQQHQPPPSKPDCHCHCHRYVRPSTPSKPLCPDPINCAYSCHVPPPHQEAPHHQHHHSHHPHQAHQPQHRHHHHQPHHPRRSSSQHHLHYNAHHGHVPCYGPCCT